MKKLDYIDNLIAEGDRFRDELVRLHRKYKFSVFDKQAESLINFANWASKLVPTVSRVKNVLDQFFKCNMCGTIPSEMMMM